MIHDVKTLFLCPCPAFIGVLIVIEIDGTTHMQSRSGVRIVCTVRVVALMVDLHLNLKSSTQCVDGLPNVLDVHI